MRITNLYKAVSFVFLTNIYLSSYGQTTIQMQKEGGVFVIPCKVNELNLKFIFDTGASDVSISLTEALFMLKNGYLNKDDILEKQYFTDATGEISVGTKIRLRKLEIAGNIINNVEASVVNQASAPLLLGQSAMSKFGNFQFDPINGTLIIINGKNSLHPNEKSYNKLPNNVAKILTIDELIYLSKISDSEIIDNYLKEKGYLFFKQDAIHNLSYYNDKSEKLNVIKCNGFSIVLNKTNEFNGSPESILYEITDKKYFELFQKQLINYHLKSEISKDGTVYFLYLYKNSKISISTIDSGNLFVLAIYQ